MLVMRDTNQTQKDVKYSRKPKSVEDRLTSEQVTGILVEIVQKIDVDDSYFKPSRVDVLPFDHPGWRRSSLVLHYSVQQLQKISQRVRSGLDPEDAGLVRPGVAVVKEPKL